MAIKTFVGIVAGEQRQKEGEKSKRDRETKTDRQTDREE